MSCTFVCNLFSLLTINGRDVKKGGEFSERKRIIVL